MARTYKDRPWKLHPDCWRNDNDSIKIEGTWRYLQLPTSKPKRRKGEDTEWHWMNTPSWWTRLMMNKPQRRAGTVWESKFVGRDIEVEMLEEEDAPGVSKRPHIYFW